MSKQRQQSRKTISPSLLLHSLSRGFSGGFLGGFSNGFSAIELLITLFVASVFLMSGYQLYTVIIEDSGTTRAESVVANTAYDYLRRYSDSATNPCAASTPLSNQAISITDVDSPVVTVTISCPQSATTTLSRIEVSISYGTGDDANTVKYATYVDKSGGTSS